MTVLGLPVMVSSADPSKGLLAASGGDTVKVFDVSVESGDRCTLSYTPSPNCFVNSVKWNHSSEWNCPLNSSFDDLLIVIFVPFVDGWIFNWWFNNFAVFF